MGQFYPGDDEFPFEHQIKTLADDELLDFWEETQFLDRSMDGPPLSSHLEYERLILMELQLRTQRRVVPASPR